MGNEMGKTELLEQLRTLQTSLDSERDHEIADKLLLQYIGDPEISEAYLAVPRWYA